jgi:hypothetical protein
MWGITARHWLLSVTESVVLPPDPIGGGIMPSIQSGPLFSVADIGVFPCKKCGKPMRLTCIEPSEPGFDTRTFECEKCRRILKFAVAV